MFLILSNYTRAHRGCLNLKLSDSVGGLSIASARSTRKSTVTAYTVRFFQVWNPVMEVMTTICTLPTVRTQFIHSIFKPGLNVIIQNKVKIMNKPHQLQ